MTEEVAERWRAEQIVTALRVQADAAKAAIEGGSTMADLGLSPREELDQTRNALLPAAPEGFTEEVFEMETGEIRTMEGSDTIVIVRLDAITPADENNAESAALVAGLRGQQNEALARGLFDIFAQDALQRAGQTIDPRAVSAVNVSFQ